MVLCKAINNSKYKKNITKGGRFKSELFNVNMQCTYILHTQIEMNIWKIYWLLLNLLFGMYSMYYNKRYGNIENNKGKISTIFKGFLIYPLLTTAHDLAIWFEATQWAGKGEQKSLNKRNILF
jgi:hypothetical protein